VFTGEFSNISDAYCCFSKWTVEFPAGGAVVVGHVAATGVVGQSHIKGLVVVGTGQVIVGHEVESVLVGGFVVVDEDVKGVFSVEQVGHSVEQVGHSVEMVGHSVG